MACVISPIIKVTEMCNFDCVFCRYSNHKQNTGIMNVDIVKKILEESAEINAETNQKVIVLFHGGEPLLWGIERFYEIYEYEKELSDKTGVKFTNSIQTNASLIDDEWIRFFKTSHIGIGISLDGPIGVNAHFSQDESLSFKRTISILDKLKNQKVSFGILSVITNKHIVNGAESFYDFLVENSIKNCGLCYCYNPDDKCSVDSEKLGYYLSDLFDLYFDGEARVNIREFNNAISAILTGKHRCCSHHQRERCGYYLTFLPSGDAFFCDPYNLRKENCLGNISECSISDMVSCSKHQELFNMIQKQVRDYCNKCSVKDICGYGCPRTDRDNEINYFCSANQILYSHIINTIKDRRKSI